MKNQISHIRHNQTWYYENELEKLNKEWKCKGQVSAPGKNNHLIKKKKKEMLLLFYVYSYNSQLSTMRRELKGYKTKMADQQKTILDYATRLDENDKKNEEMSRKYSTLLQVADYFLFYWNRWLCVCADFKLLRTFRNWISAKQNFSIGVLNLH